ncbi:BON domain-containing protein [Streptomyces sp. NPDC085479]|uniref:BON domain-containing protein n=1 Tax=Streptomyces sp. NPDC085479 TaxID=3365726 RepID=UPI0037D892E6
MTDRPERAAPEAPGPERYAHPAPGPEPYTGRGTGYPDPAPGPEPHTHPASRPEPFTHPAPGPEPYADDYRIALLRERLAVDGQAELGVRVERRGGVVLLTGTVPSPTRRDEILDLARDTLTGCAVRTEIAVAGRDAPDHGEDLP